MFLTIQLELKFSERNIVNQLGFYYYYLCYFYSEPLETVLTRRNIELFFNNFIIKP